MVANSSGFVGIFFGKTYRLGRVDKRASRDGPGVIQAGICHGDQLAPTPDERRRMVAV
jgi:hypothetical protein